MSSVSPRFTSIVNSPFALLIVPLVVPLTTTLTFDRGTPSEVVILHLTGSAAGVAFSKKESVAIKAFFESFFVLLLSSFCTIT